MMLALLLNSGYKMVKIFHGVLKEAEGDTIRDTLPTDHETRDITGMEFCVLLSKLYSILLHRRMIIS